LSTASVDLIRSQFLQRHDLADNLRESKEYREAFVEESVYTFIAFQIRSMREGLSLSQKDFGRKVEMAQERVSVLEDPNPETKPTIKTLLRIANGIDCGLEVRFIPFSKVLDQSFKSSPDELRVKTFDEEKEDLEAYETALWSSAFSESSNESLNKQVFIIWQKNLRAETVLTSKFVFPQEKTGPISRGQVHSQSFTYSESVPRIPPSSSTTSLTSQEMRMRITHAK